MIHFITTQYQPLLFILSGIALRLIIARRRFNRRGPGGLQHFRGYLPALVITAIEWIGSLAAIFLIVFGVIELLRSW